jgi:signal transduction histidine kinase
VRNATLYLLVAVIAIPALVALAAGFEPILGGADLRLYWHFWSRWFLGNALGNLTLMPVFLTWFRDDQRLPLTPPQRRTVAEALLLVVGLVLSCALTFEIPLTPFTQNLFPALLYLPVPLILAAAVRFGAKGASAAILIVTVEVLVLAMQNDAPFASLPPGHGVLTVQLFLAVMAGPTIFLAALVEELRRTSERLSGMLDGISDCYYTLDRDGRVTGVNAKGAEWWGAISPQELIGRLYSEVVGENGTDSSWVRRTINEGLPVREEIFSCDGRWVDLRAYPSARGLNIFYHDITERRAAEVAAHATQELLQSSLDALVAQIAILDGTGKILAVNAAWHKVAERLAEIGEQYLVGANFIAECERARPHQRVTAAGLRRMLRNEISEFRFEFASDVALGTWLQLRASRFGAGADRRLVIACEDISEVKAAEASLRRLTGKLLRLQDDERRRIARELHDSTAQNLLGATLGIGQALRLAPRVKSVAKAALEESRSLIQEAQREIRTVSYLLHPPMLDEAGLPAALRWLCEGFAKRTDLDVELNIAPIFERLPTEIEDALFRIAQEGLTNVHRHSGSRSVRIDLELVAAPGGERSVLLSIEDEGSGMPPGLIDQTDSGKKFHNVQNIGIGLAGMHERLFQIGGTLDIRSSPRGTSVRATVPLPAEAAPSTGIQSDGSKSARTAIV